MLRGKKSAVLALETLELSTVILFLSGLAWLSVLTTGEAFIAGLELCRKASGVGALLLTAF